MLILGSVRLPLRVEAAGAPAAPSGAGIPARFWMFAGFAVLYGICETVNGNWSQLDMTSELGASTTAAAIALTAFWAMVTVGRVVVRSRPALAAVADDVPRPAIPARGHVRADRAPARRATPALGVLAFGLAGLGCSALLPLTISFGQEELVSIRPRWPAA